MPKYLVTGGAGFIGSRVATMLLEGGHEVVACDNLNNYYDVRLKRRRLEALNRRRSFSFRETDIEDKESLRGILAEGDFAGVLNLAARAGVRSSIVNPQAYVSTNTVGTLNLLELMLEFGIGKLVLASTSSLYSGQKMPFDEDLPVNTPLSPYAASKKAAELLAHSYHYLHGVDVSIVRYFTVFGVAGRPDMSIFRFIEWIMAGRPVLIFGDGTQSRDFTYVDDVARGTIRALREVGYEIINIGGGNSPRSLLDLIGVVESALGRRAEIRFLGPSKADLDSTWADIGKAGKLLDWAPKVSLEEGIERTVEWHLENRDILDGMNFEEERV